MGDAPRVSRQRVRALAGVLAGFTWPERGTFEQLTKRQKRACLSEARAVLERLQLERLREDDAVPRSRAA
jgi:hypothetical protein